ncbi:dual oxidase maturation factor 1-like [Mizuhopecten yessoensis]|uniref:Dual oxidase maturation factor 1 n=1 Tax=Mizuhopecten yessoensis TaxID=6573 RepID=A0A210QBE9_MIZYE|nr:dual oxidase maturation factor 1-like [Mizuhopecten yessoensis]OWF46057.1 Dual oxidase maturation factor 1 [Mizuhopecten yessoensis]
MSWFQAFRGEYGFTNYGEKRTAVTMDVSLAAVIYACALISLATLIAAAGIRGKERWYTLLRVLYSLAVGSTIILSIFGYCWMEGSSKVRAPYIYRSGAKIHGEVGVIIGLTKVNITLTGHFESGGGEVAYNEEIALDGVAVPSRELKACLLRGLPDPVIAVVEYLTTDQGGLRWGRGFTMAGYIAYILLWTSFSFWFLANIMLCSVVFYGAALYTLTGICMILSNISYHVLQPTRDMRMLCSDSDFAIKYGICFWAVFTVGVITTLVGLGIMLIDYFSPKCLATFFMIDSQCGDEQTDATTLKEQKSSSLTNFHQYQKNMRRHFSLPDIGVTNKGFDFGELNRSNPVFEEKDENEVVEKDSNSNNNKEIPKNSNANFHIGEDQIVIENETNRQKHNNLTVQDSTGENVVSSAL